MEVKKRVFVFEGSKGKPFFFVPSTWDEFENLVRKEFVSLPSGVPLCFATDQGRAVTNLTELFEEKDPLVYVTVSGSNNAGVVSSNKDAGEGVSLMEMKRRERLEKQRKAKEEREAMRNKQLDEEFERQEKERREEERRQKEEEERELAEERRKKAEIEEEERKKHLKERMPQKELSALEKKIALLEGFGTHEVEEEKTIRIFLLRPGSAGKPTSVKQNTPDYTLKDLEVKAKEFFGFNPEDVVTLYSVQSGRVEKVNSLVEDDLVYVIKKGEDIQKEVQELNKVKEKSEKERKEKEERIKMEIAEEQKRNADSLWNNLPQETREKLQKMKQAELKREECSICCDDVLSREMLVVDDCWHKFCKECMGLHITTLVQNGSFTRRKNEVGLACPSLGCKQLLNIYDVKKCISKELFEKYDEMIRNRVIETSGDMMWCPTVDCGNVMVKDKLKPMVVCFHCKYNWCTSCDVKWHGDRTCKQYMEQMVYNNTASDKWVKNNTKPCPKCNLRIEKNGGCNHMTCSQCYYEFCWLCGEDYEQGLHFRTPIAPVVTRNKKKKKNEAPVKKPCKLFT